METMRPTFTPCMVLLEIVRDLDLGAGDGHGLAECMVVIFFKAEIDELVQPFS